MAGLLDSLPQDGLLGYIRGLDKATETFMGDYWRQVAPNSPAGGINLLDYLKDLDRRTGNPLIGGIVSGAQPPQQPALNVPQSGDMGMMYGQQPEAKPAPQPALPPSLASAPMSPQGAQQAFNLPTGSYEFGGQMVPTFGQPQQASPVDASAQRRGGATSVQINPQGNTVAPQAVTPGATDTAQDKWMEFLDRLSPDYVSRYRQTRQQQKSAQNLATFLQGQGMNPQQAAAMAAVASSNPKVMEELLKPPTNMEGRLASPIYGGGGTSGERMAQYQQFVQGKNAAEKAGTLEGEAAESLKSMQSKMPGLRKVVSELSGLAKEATYTVGGQVIDRAMREAGMEPRPAALARARYISMIDNQILPLLRDTFGAQFTQKEGETLRNTLGNPDLSPAEKQQVLEAFIQQKQRDIEALQTRFGAQTRSQSPASGDWVTRGNARIRRLGD